MNDNDRLDKRYRTIAWGAFFILIGSLSLIPGDQTVWAILGSGILLLGLNLVRWLGRVPLGVFSLALGAILFLGGALVLFRSVLGFHFEIDLFPLLLLALGIYLLLPGRKRAAS